MSQFKVNSIANQVGNAGPQICGITTFSGKSGFRVPSGKTGSRAGVGDLSNRDGLIFYADGAASRIGISTEVVPIYDLSPLGKVGEMINGASVASDKGGVFNFDGSDDFLTFPPIEQPFSNFTFVVWCYSNEVTDGDAVFAYGESFASDKAKCVIRLNNGGAISWWFEASDDADYNIYSNGKTVDAGKNRLTNVNTFPANTWVMVTAQWDDVNMKQIMHVGTTSYNNLYSNGLTRDKRPSNIEGDGPLLIGCRGNGGNAYQNLWDGQVSMACIYDRVLDDAELTQIWNETSGRLGY